MVVSFQTKAGYSIIIKKAILCMWRCDQPSAIRSKTIIRNLAMNTIKLIWKAFIVPRFRKSYQGVNFLFYFEHNKLIIGIKSLFVCLLSFFHEANIFLRLPFLKICVFYSRFHYWMNAYNRYVKINMEYPQWSNQFNNYETF